MALKIPNLFVPGGTLLGQVLKGGAWMLGLRIAQRLMGLVRLTVLAWLLSTHDFGLFGIALLTLSLLESLSRTGFLEALIQKERQIESFLNTAWTIHVVRGLVLAVIVFLVAPAVASFFKEPMAGPLLSVLSLNLIVVGFTNISVVYFQKDLEFHKQFFFMISGALADLAVSIVAAVILRNAWALVYGVLAGNLVRAVVSHLVAAPVRFELKWDKARELAGFGRWIWGTNVALYLLNEGDDIFVGKVLGTDTLGIYRMAYQYGNLPATEIAQVISQVTFPAYARLQHNLLKLRDGFLRTLSVTAFISAPLAAGIIVMTPSFVEIFMPDRWLPMVLPMQILAFWGLIRSIGATTGPVFHGLGRPDIVTRLTILKVVILAVLIYPLTLLWGLAGTATAVVGAALLINPITDYMVIRITGSSAREFISALIHPVAASLIMVASILGLDLLTGSSSGPVLFFISILVGVVVYFAVIGLFRSLFGYDITEAFREDGV